MINFFVIFSFFCSIGLSAESTEIEKLKLEIEKLKLENENHLQHGLYLFKRGFNEEVTEFVGCWDLPINQNKFRIWKGQESNFLKLYAKMKKNLFW